MDLKMGMDVHMCFQIPVVGLDVRSINEVCNLTALYKSIIIS